MAQRAHPFWRAFAALVGSDARGCAAGAVTSIPTALSTGVPVGPAFDLFGELSFGTTVLEASAGTGKTFTIAALVVRFVAEDRARLDQMLIVTFSRAATGELRERGREIDQRLARAG